MKFKSTLIALSVSTLLFSGVVSAAITGTDSVSMTIQTKVVSGTCTAKFQAPVQQKCSTAQVLHPLKLHLAMYTNRIW